MGHLGEADEPELGVPAGEAPGSAHGEECICAKFRLTLMLRVVRGDSSTRA